MPDTHSLLLAAVMAAVTALLRFAPFLIFRTGADTPPIIRRLGTLLPCAVMGMLVVYCLRNVSLTASPHGIPEALACLVTGGLYVWRRSTLLSIVAGTACYMLLVQLVFV